VGIHAASLDSPERRATMVMVAQNCLEQWSHRRSLVKVQPITPYSRDQSHAMATR